MLFGPHVISHLTLYIDLHNTHAILTFCMYVGDVTVNERLERYHHPHPRETVATDCLYCSLYLLYMSAPAVLFHSKFRRQAATSLNHSSRTSLAASLIIVRMR